MQGRARVLGRHLQKLAIGAPLWHIQDNLLAPLAAQPLLDDLALVDFLGQQDVGRHISSFIVELLDEGRNQLPVLLADHSFQHEVLAADQFAAPDEEHLHASFARSFVLGKGDDVLVFLLAADDLLSLHD